MADISDTTFTGTNGLNPDDTPPSNNADDAGDTFLNDGFYFLRFKNDNASACVVTIPRVGTVDGQAIPDLQITVPAGEQRICGMFPFELFSDPTTFKTSISYSLSPPTSVAVSLIAYAPTF